MADIEAIRARWAAGTPGPWIWAGVSTSQTIDLMRARGWGDTVMAFRRWGTQGAQPSFNIDGLLYAAAKGPGGAPLWITPQDHNPWMIRGIDHPDAIKIAAAPDDVAALLAEVDRLRAALAAIADHQPYPADIFTPLTAQEEEAVREAIRAATVRYPLDRTWAQWGRCVLAQTAEMARAALVGAS